jgi:hypothetical protein
MLRARHSPRQLFLGAATKSIYRADLRRDADGLRLTCGPHDTFQTDNMIQSNTGRCTIMAERR